MVEELKPCPFCGETKKIVIAWTRIDAETTWWSAECHGCGLQILPRNSEAAAIAAWNSRTPTPDGTGSGEGFAQKQAREVMMPGFGSASAPSDGQSYGMSSTPKRDEEQVGEGCYAALKALCKARHVTGVKLPNLLHDAFVDAQHALAAAHKEQS